ncbi:hypothetical protein B0H15DRAFT_30633 [Mycena belliarum]|uniref:Uncharacterized protein n=1 Tax=Mycena belliarum TaxID=1033014 RepID=A0AAD6UA81_9AGAR|nr:hypothetical protein B0H15DRAFT_30633 [Mycena belliae]
MAPGAGFSRAYTFYGVLLVCSFVNTVRWMSHYKTPCPGSCQTSKFGTRLDSPWLCRFKTTRWMRANAADPSVLPASGREGAGRARRRHATNQGPPYDDLSPIGSALHT